MNQSKNKFASTTDRFISRGIVHLDLIKKALHTRDKHTIEQVIHQHRSNFMFSYTGGHFQLHAVDRLALYPLFYTIKNGKPYVSQVIDDLVPLLDKRVLHPEGFYGTGGLDKGGRTNYSPYRDIMRIPPGHYLIYQDGRYDLIQYWSFLELADNPYEGSYDEACDILGSLIKQGVDRCYAYKPDMAVHLSGGLDSGSITALLAQSKTDTIYAYAHVKPDAPDDDPILENGYLRKYVAHYPHIALQKSHTLKFQEQNTRPIDPLGNWHGVRHDSPEGHICQDLNSKNVSFLLSGMGGDELASYGHHHQKRRKTLYNDDDARRFMYRDIYLKRKAKFLVKGLLGMDGPRIDSIRSTLMMNPFTEQAKYYNKDYRMAVPQLNNESIISLYWFPSSYRYRLDTLQRSFFTIRSDIWNYLSKYYGVDYMFPLLDADLIDFCARMPRGFFIGRQQRQMIKTGLAKYLPHDLLGGGKRPGYQSPLGTPAPIGIKQHSMDDVLAICKEQLLNAKNTLAAQVYDLSYISQLLHKHERLLTSLPSNRHQMRQISERQIRTIYRYLDQHVNYVNDHFDDIGM